MSMKLSFCLKAATTLTEGDLGQITDAIEAYVRGGMDTEQAESMAVGDLMAQVMIERTDMTALLRQQHPDLFQADRPALATKPAPDDLGAMFDDLMAEEATKPPAVPAKERRERAKKTVKQAARSARASEADDQAASLNSMAKDIEREPIASVVSAAKNAAKAMDDAIAGLGKLFGGNKGTLGSGPVFNEETYAAAKPLFASAVANLENAAADIKQAMREVIRMVVDRFGRDVAENMKPYVVRFIEDLRDGKAELPTKEAEDGQSNAGAPGAETLDDVAAGEGPGAAGGGQAGRGGAGGRGRRPTRNAGTGEPRVSGARSGGSGSTSVRAPAAGAGGGGQRRRGKGTARDGAGVPASDARDGLTPISVPNIPAVNYRITDDTRLGKGGEAEKFRDNVAAIKALKAIEAEGRRATPAEQRVLARYVGWGGLANAFAAPESGKFKPDWEDRGKSLVDLLTPKELALARRSTLDAHYTSEDVIGAMWSAARRLGFAGGSVLESSMGVGNFLGLLPEDLTANTKFVGVEYDSLTARIAALLYPNETVLHSGFQKVPVPDGAFDLSIGNPPFGEQSLRFQFKPELNRTSIHNQFIRAALDAVKPGGLQIQVVSRYLMDKQDSADRLAIAGKARLLGAIRLPDTAFKENARTEVVTDILFFQRLTAEEEAHMASVIEAAKGAKEKDWKKEQARRALADEMPAWVEVGTVPDPLGGEAMTVNRYFQRNQHMIMGTLERSGSMQFQNDITVRLDKGNSLPDLLNQAIENLPEGVLAQAPDAIAASIERFKSMSDGLRIALSGQESGHILLDADGKLQQVVERETPEGGHELAKRELTAASPWSDTLLQQSDGKWYTLEVKLDEKGQPVKMVKGDKTTKLNVYERKVYDSEAQIPAGLLLGDAKYARLVDLVKLRDLYVKQINLETEDAPEAKMEGNRAKLAEAYKTFTDAHGWVSDPSNEALVRNMPDGALISSLEVSYKPAISPLRAKNTGETARPAIAKPSDILTRRVVPKYEPPGTASTPADALQISLSEFGKVNLERMGALLGMSPEEVVDALHTNLEKPLIYKDPESQRWETRNDYLSGHVKRKLIVARSLGLAKNITALEEVQPDPWGAESVSVILGATWVPPQIYADFVKRITGVEARVSFSELTNTFAVQMVGTPQQAAMDEWGADGMSPQSLIQHMLNSKPTRVYDETLDGPKLNVEKTALAGIKATQIASEFTDWVFTDGERRAKLVEVFNEKFNTRVTRQHDGSHLVLPGKVPDAVVAMRRHQLNAIWRGISERFTLYDHVVGAGKTFTAIARVMERRRMGLSRKPMIAVPNHMVEQFTTDVYRLYPGAKVLAAGKADFEKRRRRKLFAKIASGDWDVVIVPHSSFGFIGISQETEERYLEQEIETAEKAIKAAWEESGEVESKGGRGAPKPLTVKEAERLRDKLTARMDKIKGKERRDRLLTFEQMGVDDLTVDEAHEFKNLFYSSRLADVRGMGNRTGSQKAFDLYSKVRVLTESPTGSVTFMTGTPISNSAVEMYSVLRYLAAKELKELGLEHFDAFRTQYVSAEPGFEPTESGRLKEVTRLGRSWSNMRSLMDLYYSVTDAVTIEDIKKAYAEDNPGQQFPVPTVKGGERQSVIVKPTEAQVEHLEQILEEFDSLPNIKDPYDRNIARLKLMDRARKISLDTRAAFPGADTNEKGGKLDVIADNAKRIYDQWDADKGTQLIFLDRSVPKAKGDDKILKDYDALVKARDAALAAQDEDGYRQAVDKLEAFNGNEMEELRIAQAGGWNAYQQIKDNLIASGIPAGEIRFIQEASNDAQKQALFDAVNDGTVRVLIGSTQRMGAGTNVQQRLVGLHHADVTWKPSDIEQREGRIVRQPRGDGGSLIEKYGVGNFEVEILAYATERTMDAKMWALNSTKLKTINAIRKYDGAFTMDFEDEDSISMAELAALASGDPLLLERVKLTSEIDKLALLQRQHQRKNWGIESSIESAQSDIKNLPAKIVANQRLAEELRRVIDRLEAGAAARRVTVEGKEFAKMVEAVAAAEASIETQQAGNEKARYSVTVDGKKFTNKEGYLGAIHGAIGDFEPFEVVMDGQTYRVRTDVQRELASKARDIAERLANGTSETVKLGTFAGLRFEMDVSVSSGGSMYWAELTVIGADGQTVRSNSTEKRDNSVFTTQSFMNALRGIDLNSEGPASQAEYLRKRLERSKESLPGLLEKRNQPFAQADEMRAKQDRLEEVIKILSSGPKVPTTDERDIRAEEWDMANPTGWPNIPDMNFSLEQEDFQDTEVLPPMTGVEVQERDLRKEDADGLAMVEKAFRVKIEQFKGLKLTLLPTPSKPADNAPKAEKVRYAAVELAARLFGKRVIFYRANMQFANGIQADYVPGAIFVNEATTRPWMAVIGHELLHALQQDQPALYAKLGDRLRSLLENPGAYGAELNRRRAARGMPPLGFDKLREELIADIVGDNFTDPVFWRQMAAGQPSMFQRVLQAIRDFFDAILAKLENERPYDTKRYLNDVRAARDAVADAMKAFAESPTSTAGAKSIEANLDATNDPFYSALAREIELAPMNGGTAEAWRNLLKGLVAKGAVKADELTWSGIEDWLGMQAGRIPRATVMEYLSANGVKVTETTLGVKYGPGELDSLLDQWAARNQGPTADAINSGETWNRTAAIAERNGDDEVVRMIRRDDESANFGPDTHPALTLPGATNYREVLLTLPSQRDALIAHRTAMEKRGALLQGNPNYAQDRAEYDARQAQIVATQDYKSGHWDQLNVLAHIRLNDRTDADGKRVLFVEEIQSDYAQAARKGRNDRIKTIMKNEGITKQEAEKRVPEDAGFIGSMIPQNRQWKAVDTLEEGIETRSQAEAKMRELEPFLAKHAEPGVEDRLAIIERDDGFVVVQESRSAVAFAPAKMGVPRAPFVGKTDAWVALAIKRVIALAAREGYDRVAFVTGEQSAERYSLDKHVGRVTYVPGVNGGTLLATDKADNAFVISETNVAPEKLADYVGKDVAEKLLRQPLKDGSHVLTGAGLKVPQGGMRAFYDQIVPKVVKEVLRKVGGGQIGEVTIGKNRLQLREQDGGWVIADTKASTFYQGPRSTFAWGVKPKVYLSESSAQLALDALPMNDSDVALQQPGFDITPAMREKAVGGLPMFSLEEDQDQLASPGLARRITQGLHDLVDSPETFNWWHKGPGTQFHKATVSSLFKAVFDIAQDYIHDTSAFANRAADFAPTLLPSLSKFTDLFKRLSLKPTDQAAAADAIFTGTLDNVVYSEEELDRMGLTEKQKSLYAEFRMAVDKSLDQLVAAEVARLVGELADPYKPLIQADKLAAFERNVRKAVIAQKDAADTFLADVRKRHKRERAQMAKAHELEASDVRNTRPPAQSLMEDRHKDARNGLALRQGQEKYRAEKELQHWEQMEWDVADRYEKIDTLKENGYAPLMRFGQYTMTVRERESGDVAFFGMYESRLELNRAARAAVADYDREFYSVEKGTMSAEAWKLFKGVSPETLAIFGDAAGMDKGDNKALFDKYIRLATSNHSALKRLLHRKKTPGFSKDPSRVLAAFITSNARRSAQQLHFGDMSKAVNAARESKQGDVADEAWRLQDYMQNPQEEAAAAKSLMFVQYLGGSVASAMVNMTQPITTTLPYLSSVSNPAAALASITKAIAQLAPGAIDPRSDLGKALKMAEDEGIVAPQEMHELQAEATRTLIDRIPFARDTMRKIMFGWGSLFSAAELINRRITFVAAYNMAAGMDPAKLAKLGYPSPFGFAANAVDETQFVYTKASRPRWARGAIGGLLLTFKTYSISYLELFWRMPKREKVLMLGTLMLMAGASGLPGADDLDDVVDAFGQRLGYDTNSKDFRQRVLTEAFGPQWAAFVQRGVTGLAGSPIDVAGRLSMGNLIPGTGLLRKDLASPERELFDVAGPLGSYIKGLVDAARGDATKALPSSIANMIKAADMLRTGAYRDARGNTVIQTTKVDAAVKAVGFQPGEVAQVQRDSQIKAQRTALARTVESEIVADWAAGIFEKDKAKQDAARRRLIEWNQKNPRTPIEVTDEQIEKRVESMMLTRQQRMLKAAPREMRPTLR